LVNYWLRYRVITARKKHKSGSHCDSDLEEFRKRVGYQKEIEKVPCSQSGRRRWLWETKGVHCCPNKNPAPSLVKIHRADLIFSLHRNGGKVK